MIEEYITKLKPLVEELFKDESSGHDIGHLVRTMNLALYICEKENGDELIVGISAFLHDVHRIMENEINKNGSEYRFVSPKESLPKVKEMLSHIDLTDEQVNEICFCIENHENYNWSGDNVDDINALILQDADNLDAIGAIGIARSLTYSGANNIAVYDDTKPLITDANYKEGDKDPSVLHHFYHKLFKLGDQMNTKTAREIAEKRIQFMKDFTKEFLDEWNLDEYKKELKFKKI